MTDNKFIIEDGIVQLFSGGGSAWIYLRNPPVNALSVKLVDELSNALSYVAQNKDFKFLSIEGVCVPHFSAGADLKERASMSEDETLEFLNKLNNCENIILSENYRESFYSYKLCANADLVIAKHTSLADECLSHEIPVLFYDFTHNMKGIQSDAFDYSPSGLMCYNFEELLKKSKSLLFDSSSKLKDEINALNKTIYYVKEKGNIKNKIIENLENLLNSTGRHTI